MKKIVFILLIVLLLPACTREIVLRKNQSMVAPFNEKTFPKGNYELTLYKINYPKGLKEKQVFLNELNVLLKKYYLGDKKINLLIEKDFYTDLNSLKVDFLLQEEKIYDKQASLLSDEEIKVLIKNSGKRIEKFRDTTQEYLSFQIEYLLRFLGKENTYDENKIYSERHKSELIDEIKEMRKENFNLLDNVKLQFVLQIENPYDSETGENYWDNREITLKDNNNLSKDLNDYEMPLYITGLKEKDINALIKEEYQIGNKTILLENDMYYGYKKTDGSYIFLIGGNKKMKSYEHYDFSFKIIEIELKDMVNLKNDITIAEILGGKK